MHGWRKILWSVALIATMAAQPSAWAQNASVQSSDNARDGADSGQAAASIDEIVVTAQRRSENLQEAPIAITALSSDTLKQRNVQTTLDLMQTVPGLQVSTQTGGDGEGSATFFLRGMGQQQANNGSEPAVGVYIDDIYYPTPEGAIFDILDLEQVEVLRGPQGTLFGRDTIGGAIRYTTKKPDFSGDTGYFQATGGSFDRHDFTGSVNIAVSDKLAFRFTAGSLDTDGYVRQQDGDADAGGTKTDLVRAQVRFEPVQALDINVSGQYSHFHEDGFPYTQPQINSQPGSVPTIWNSIPPGMAAPYDNRYASQCIYCQAGTAQREFADDSYYSVTGVATWAIDENLTLKSLTSWQAIDSTSFIDLDGTPLPIFSNNYATDTSATSQEFQLNGHSLENRLDWVAGGYFYHYWSEPAATRITTVLGGGTLAEQSSNTTVTKAGFLDATFSITDIFKILGGARYSVDDKTFTLFDGSGDGISQGAASFNSTTWRAGLEAQWSKDIMTYFTVSTGFRAGGFNAGVDADPTFKPEKATSYELGTRLEALDHRLRFNPTVFYTDWNDIQVQSVVVSPTLGAVAVLQNAAKAHSYGLELESDAAVAGELRLFGNLALLHIKYDSIGDATGITLDSHFERAPTVTYALGAMYEGPVADGVTYKSTLNWSWEGVQYSTPTDVDALRLPSYGLLNGRVEFTDRSTQWTVALFGTNLTNRAYYVGGVNYSSNVGAAHYDLGRPREFGASLRFRF
jgi:iron complex outermembrane recepter protein